jgi:3-mercaptopyruvate sulfurtransferase SseA
MRLTVSLAAACLVALALVAACSPRDGSASASGAAAQNTKTGGTASPSQTQTPAPQDDGVRRVTQEELRASLEKGGDAVAVFDVRDKASYAAGHIRGSKLVPWDQVEHRLGEFPKDKLVVTYCA